MYICIYVYMLFSWYLILTHLNKLFYSRLLLCFFNFAAIEFSSKQFCCMKVWF